MGDPSHKEEHDRTVDQVNREMGFEGWTWRDVPRGFVRMIKEILRIWRVGTPDE